MFHIHEQDDEVTKNDGSSIKAMNECVFCAIVEKNSSSSIIFEEKETMCFLDRRPVFPGHCLLIPKYHYQTIHDLPSTLINRLFNDAKLLAKVVQSGMNAQGVFIGMNNIVSQSVPHFHIHIVPRTKGDGLKGFFWPRQNYKDQVHMQEVQMKLQDLWQCMKIQQKQ